MMLERLKRNEFVQITAENNKDKVAQVKEMIRVFESLDDEKKVNIELPEDALIEGYFTLSNDKVAFISKKDMRKYAEVTPKYKLHDASSYPLTSLKRLSGPIQRQADKLLELQEKAGILFTDEMRKKNLAYLQGLVEKEKQEAQKKELEVAVQQLMKTLNEMDEHVKQLYTTKISEQGDTILYDIKSPTQTLTIEWLKKYRQDMIVLEMFIHDKKEDDKRNYQYLSISNLSLLEQKVKEHIREAVGLLYEPKDMLNV
ncbi:hypothetical protein CN918_29710 [Priestia megaterium]|nr:hypothetical protein CN918_29710 [Priestia megaterium]